MAAIFFYHIYFALYLSDYKSRSFDFNEENETKHYVCLFFFAQVFSWWSHKFNSLALNSQDFHSKEFNISPSFYSYPAELTY